jgi:hypothetical protein
MYRKWENSEAPTIRAPISMLRGMIQCQIQWAVDGPLFYVLICVVGAWLQANLLQLNTSGTRTETQLSWKRTTR